jgi:hypothetical protein
VAHQPTSLDALAISFPEIPATLPALLAEDRLGGKNIRVGIIDTGIDRETIQRRFQRSMAIEGAVFASERLIAVYQGQQSAPHGTTVAGILLRHAPGVDLVSADVFGAQGRCEAETLIQAIRWCVEEAHCRVLNLSLGISEDRLFPIQRRWQLQRVIEDCYHRNVMIIAAAHNDHPSLRSFPAVLGAPLIGVDKGPWHDELRVRYLPNERVEFQATGSCEGDLFSSNPATSWAAPHLTAIVARLLALRPGLRPFEVKTLLCRLATS